MKLENDVMWHAMHWLGVTKPQINVVQIGCMDGKTLDKLHIHTLNDHWKCLFVEPIKEYFDKLVDNKKKSDMFENAAITKEDGDIDMFVIDPQKLADPNFEIEWGAGSSGYAGMSTLLPPKNGFVSDYNRDIIIANKYGKMITVKGMTLNSLLTKHGISEIDVFSVDTEGYDWDIFDDLDLEKYKPHVIELEIMNSSEKEKTKIFSKLENYNYAYYVGLDNVFACPMDTYFEIKKWEAERHELE